MDIQLDNFFIWSRQIRFYSSKVNQSNPFGKNIEQLKAKTPLKSAEKVEQKFLESKRSAFSIEMTKDSR